MKSCERSIIRINQLRIINSKLSPRRSGADVVANLKFIILGMTRVANSKIIIQSVSRMATYTVPNPPRFGREVSIVRVPMSPRI